MSNFKVNYDKIGMALESGVKIDSLSTYGRFAIQCLGYKFYDKEGRLLDKWELFAMNYDNIGKLFNNDYPISIIKR